jgi:hypothetical protein
MKKGKCSMKKQKHTNAQGRIAKSSLYFGTLLEDQLLHDKDGSSRFGVLMQVSRGKNKVWVSDNIIYERASDGKYWNEVSAMNVKSNNKKQSVNTISGGAPGLCKNS